MSEEIFDIVNDRDEVVGQAPRSEVHAKKLLHRAVHVLVFNSRGQVFLQKRSMLKDTAKGKWDSSSSGHVDSGEDYDPCAVRELREEIGLHLAMAPERILRIEACADTGQEFVWVYRCQSEGPFTLHPDEIERGALVCAGRNHSLDGRTPAGICPRVSVDLGLGCQRKAPVSPEKNLNPCLTVLTVPHKQTAQFNRKQPCLKNQSNNASRTSSSSSSA
ncbi:MAG: NUDIX domain-containing protein [Verrucomicrobiota bacterium]